MTRRYLGFPARFDPLDRMHRRRHAVRFRERVPPVLGAIKRQKRRNRHFGSAQTRRVCRAIDRKSRIEASYRWISCHPLVAYAINKEIIRMAGKRTWGDA